MLFNECKEERKRHCLISVHKEGVADLLTVTETSLVQFYI